MAKNRVSSMLFYEDAKKSVKLVRAVCKGKYAGAHAALANRIFMSLLAQIDYSDPNRKRPYQVLFTEIEKRAGVHLEYPAAAACCDAMAGMTMGVVEGRRRTWYAVFSKIILEDGVITAVWNDEIIPLLSNLGFSNPYIHYNLLEYLKLGSNYSQKLYELLIMFKQQGNLQPFYDLAQLQNLLGIPEKIRANSKETRRVIERAKKEIYSKTNLTFAWEFDKKYRPKQIRFYLGETRLPKLIEQEKQRAQAEHDKTLQVQKECMVCVKQHNDGCPHYKASRKSKCAVCRRMGFFDDKSAPLFDD